MGDLLAEMLARRAQISAPPEVVEAAPDSNPPFDEFTENIARHWRRLEKHAELPKRSAIKPEASVLRSLKVWLKKVPGIDTRRVSVGQMRNKMGFTMSFGGESGESDLVLTPHKGMPFERQIFVEAKRPDVIIEGKKVQRAGKQSANQVLFQQKVEARGDKYVVVTSVEELREFLASIGFSDLPPAGRKKKE